MKRKIYKHRFTITVLSEEPLVPLVSLDGQNLVTTLTLEEINCACTNGYCLGSTELESCREVTGLDRIRMECRALHNDGEFFTAIWDEEEEDAAAHAKD